MDKFNHAALSEKFMQMLFVTHYNFFRQTAIPIPANHFGVLLILSDHGPSTVSDLCIYLRMSKQQMTPIINKTLFRFSQHHERVDGRSAGGSRSL